MTYEKSGLFFVETKKALYLSHHLKLTNTERLGLAYTCGSFTIKRLAPNRQTESLNLKFRELEITQ